jgi:hypothetical protein
MQNRHKTSIKLRNMRCDFFNLTKQSHITRRQWWCTWFDETYKHIICHIHTQCHTHCKHTV